MRSHSLRALNLVLCRSVNRMVTKRMVTRLGCEVTVVGSGRECVAALTPGHGFKVSRPGLFAQSRQ